MSIIKQGKSTKYNNKRDNRVDLLMITAGSNN